MLNNAGGDRARHWKIHDACCIHLSSSQSTWSVVVSFCHVLGFLKFPSCDMFPSQNYLSCLSLPASIPFSNKFEICCKNSECYLLCDVSKYLLAASLVDQIYFWSPLLSNTCTLLPQVQYLKYELDLRSLCSINFPKYALCCRNM